MAVVDDDAVARYSVDRIEQVVIFGGEELLQKN